MILEITLINGIKLGIEHVSIQDNDIDYIIALDLFLIRLSFIRTQ